MSTSRRGKRLDVRLGRRTFEISAVVGRQSLVIRDDQRFSVEVDFCDLTEWMTVDQLHSFLRLALDKADRREDSKRRAIASATRKRIRERDGNRCHYCKREGEPRWDPDRKSWHIDHVVPVVHGGTDADENLVLACAACNLRKSDREYDVFVASLTPQPRSSARPGSARTRRGPDRHRLRCSDLQRCPVVSGAFCSQCYGKGWVRVDRRIVQCIACIVRRERQGNDRGPAPEVEHRGDRPAYDERDASHLRHPNGSLVASFDRTFLGAATRHVLAIYDQGAHQ